MASKGKAPVHSAPPVHPVVEHSSAAGPSNAPHIGVPHTTAVPDHNAPHTGVPHTTASPTNVVASKGKPPAQIVKPSSATGSHNAAPAQVNGVAHGAGPANDQYPDYILDMEDPRLIDPVTKRPGDWCIRKWSDVEADVAKEGYGIVSYVWGTFHDKDNFVLGGTIVGTVVHQNPNGYPTFDIGVSSTPSTTGPNLYDPATVKTKPFIDTFKTKTGRLIPEKTPLTWLMPVVYWPNTKEYEFEVLHAAPPPFTISDIKTALRALKIRYIWWDWACVPQGWDTVRSPANIKEPVPNEVQFHIDLKDVQSESTNKMRYFYPASTKGCVWWYRKNEWTFDPPEKRAKPASAAQQVLESMQNMVSREAKVKVGSLPTGEFVDVPAQRIVGEDTEEASSKTTTAPPSIFANLQHDEVTDYVKKLEALRADEKSLESLWCLQEHVLYV